MRRLTNKTQVASFIEDCSSVRDGSVMEEPEREQDAATPNTPNPREELSGKTLRPKLTSRKSSRRVTHAAQLKSVDSMAHMYTRAADILRDATLADGCAIFGASPSSGRVNSINSHFGSGAAAQPSPASDSEKHDTNTSDSDSSPAARPCKILAYSIADEAARGDIENGTALTLGTLDKYVPPTICIILF